jgi:hypothetical protein
MQMEMPRWHCSKPSRLSIDHNLINDVRKISVFKEVTSNLTMRDLINGSIIINVNVETATPLVSILTQTQYHLPIRLMIHRLHITRLQDTMLTRQILLCKVDLIAGLANLFAHQLVHPVVRLVAVFGLETWYYERHID